MEEMIKSGAHFGYSATTLNPKMKPYIFAYRNNTEVFDLEKTLTALEKAKEFVKSLAKEKKTILFAGTKKEAKQNIESVAKELNMPYVIERWLGGMLTNFKQIKSRIDHLNDLYEKKESGEFEKKYTKKERLQIERKIIKLNKYLGGLRKWQSLPACLVAVDSGYEKTAVREAKNMKIPLVVLMSSDCNPEDADYPVPANDSSISSINFFLKELSGAYKEGIKEYDNSGTN